MFVAAYQLSVQKVDKQRQNDADINKLIHSVIDSIH